MDLLSVRADHRRWVLKLAGCLLALAGMETASVGGFIGLEVRDITNNQLGLREYAIYAVFDAPGDVLYGIGNANIASTTGFFHNTIDGQGASALPFTAAQTAISDHPDVDSFVTISFDTGDNNTIVLSADFDTDAFINGTTLGESVGWAVTIPPPVGKQGNQDQEGRVLIAVFAPLNGFDGSPGTVTGSLLIGWDAPGQTVQFSPASFITPAPGALGLLALAGLTGRSRRRRDRRSGPRRVGDGEVQPPLLRPRWK